jgi:hypothetical protein
MKRSACVEELSAGESSEIRAEVKQKRRRERSLSSRVIRPANTINRLLKTAKSQRANRRTRISSSCRRHGLHGARAIGTDEPGSHQVLSGGISGIHSRFGSLGDATKIGGELVAILQRLVQHLQKA